MLTETPRYRVTAPHAVINGCLYNQGAEITFHGWPKLHELEPVNEAAKRVSEYFTSFRFSPFVPSSPYNRELGGIFLPAVLPDFGPGAVVNRFYDEPKSSTVSPVREGEIVEGMPRYKSDREQLLGKTHVPAAQEFCFLGWPLESFTAVNDSAKSVKAYYEANKDNPKLLSSPWCCYRQDVVLPELPAAPDSKRNMTGAMDAEIARNQSAAEAAARQDRSQKRGSWAEIEG